MATAEGADADEPERAFASAAVITMVFSIVKSPLLGYAKEFFGYRGVFLALASYYLLIGCALFVVLLRAPTRTRAAPSRAASNLSFLGVLGVLAVMGMYSLATGGVFAFVERVSTHVGISASELGRGFAITALIATLGGAAASRLGLRLGRALPTLGGLAVLGVLSLFLMAAPTTLVFWSTYVPWAVVYWFSYAYIMGLSVLVDPLGRLATVTSPC